MRRRLVLEELTSGDWEIVARAWERYEEVDRELARTA